MAEAVLRPYERSLESRKRLPRPPLALLQPNPHGTGSYRLRPDLRLTARVGRREIPIETNRFGMRWREVSLGKPAGRRRVAFVGDSFTFGCWSSRVETSFVGVFESAFAPHRWEALNFGVGGYGLADIELLLEEEVLRFSPDYVVLGFFAGNDFRDTWLGLDKERLVDGTAELDDAVVRRRVPASELDEDTTVSRDLPAQSAVGRSLERLALFRFLAPWLRAESLAVDFAVNRNFTMYSYWSQFPYPEAARRARDEWLGRLLRLEERLRARGVRLGIVAIPFMEQTYSHRLASRGYDVGLPQAYVQVAAREHGIPYLDLLPLLRAHVRETHERVYLPNDTHFNDAGHRVAGEAIAAWFRCCVRW